MANDIKDLKTLFDSILNIQQLTINKVNSILSNCTNSLSAYYTKTQIDTFNFLTSAKLDVIKKDDGSYVLTANETEIGVPISIEKDTFLDSVDTDTVNNTLIFNWNTESGKSQVTIPLSSIADVYKEGNGIKISNDGTISTIYKQGNGLTIDTDGTISVKISGTGLSYLESTPSGINADALKSKIDQLEAGINAGIKPGDISTTLITNESNMPGATLNETLNIVYDIVSGTYLEDLEIEINALKELLETE